jgi:hypothetical protein
MVRVAKAHDFNRGVAINRFWGLGTVRTVLLLKLMGAKAKPFYKLHVNAAHLACSPLHRRGAGGEAERMASGEWRVAAKSILLDEVSCALAAVGMEALQ